MALKIDDLGLREPPKLPEAVPVFELSAPSFASRRAGLARLSDLLGLGDLRMVELDHGVVLGGERGEIEYFHASGAVWARDATAADRHKTELRKWEGAQETKRGPQRVTLNAEASKRLIGAAHELLQATGLIGREAAGATTVELDQVARLDAKGNELSFGAGRATVKVSYEVEGLAVRGPGAKSLVFADPGTAAGGPQVAGAFHAWRTLGSARTVKLPSVEAALRVGLLVDPELELYRKAGHTIRVTRLDFGYLALPAFVRQGHLFPAFQVEGEVSKGKRGDGFRFGRYHHAAPPKAYAAADLYGPYLSANPDGIAPAGAAQRG
jgi:hypothetical protein